MCADLNQAIYNPQYPVTATDPNSEISRNEDDAPDTKETSCPLNTEKTLRRPETELVMSGEPAKDPSEVQQEHSTKTLNQSDKHPCYCS